MLCSFYDLRCSCCSDEEGSELADLQRVLQKVVSSKKANARQKQAEIIQVTCWPCAFFYMQE